MDIKLFTENANVLVASHKSMLSIIKMQQEHRLVQCLFEKKTDSYGASDGTRLYVWKDPDDFEDALLESFLKYVSGNYYCICTRATKWRKEIRTLGYFFENPFNLRVEQVVMFSDLCGE